MKIKFRRVAVYLTTVLVFLLTAPSAWAGYLYVHRQIDLSANQIYGYSVNESTGALTLLAGFPVASGGNGSNTLSSQQITVDKINGRLFIINDDSDTLSAFTINGNGSLTAMPFSPITLSSGSWASVRVHPSGSPVIVGSSGSTATIHSFTITPTTATEAVGSPYSTSSSSAFITAFSRNGDYLYAGGNVNNLVSGYAVNTATGVLTALAGSPFNSGTSTNTGFATDAAGRFFLTGFSANEARAFTTAAGIPTAVTGNPFTSGLSNAVDGAMHPNDNFYVVADRFGNRVGSYQISGSGAATTLTAVAGSPFASGGAFTNSLVFNAVGNYLFATNGNTRNLTTYSVNTGTGVLTLNNTQPANTQGTTGRLVGIAYMTSATAAAVSVGGRITASSGTGIRNVIVTLTAGNGITRNVLTSSFGYYNFDDVAVGETYVVSVAAKRFTFANPTQIISVNDNIGDLDFIAE